MTNVPTKEGFYWCKWRLPEEGMDEKLAPHVNIDKWEVVEVHLNGEDDWRFSVAGVVRSQSVENAYWGKDPQPLQPPPDKPKRKRCSACDGRGWVGGTLQTPKITCRRCGGSKEEP